MRLRLWKEGCLRVRAGHEKARCCGVQALGVGVVHACMAVGVGCGQERAPGSGRVGASFPLRAW